ncbi:M1 aminopeptidase family protein [Terriglobus tenax]|uniref:hypothetical protein n=1 Tax=Terriglobus tenax TaxID=1111115 RepID=UPI0021E04BB0|nr:hypothetical protein [Terriglobus tenax]
MVLAAGVACAQQQPEVIYHRDEQTVQTEAPGQKQGEQAPFEVADALRSSLVFTAYDLDVHLNTTESGLSVRALVTVRNAGDKAIAELPLQISSSLHWETARLVEDGKPVALKMVQHAVKTDLDHTGAMSEAVLTLPRPLPVGAAVTVDVFYSGKVEQVAGAESSSAAASAEWDRVTDEFTGLRGFGNVLWYPVSEPPAFLGDGNRVYDLVGRNRLATQAAKLSARLTVEYAGDPPRLAFLCGHQAILERHQDNPNEPSAAATGVATASFEPFSLGFHPVSLFLTKDQPEMVGGGYLGVISEDDDRPRVLNLAALKVLPLLTAWLGARPNGPLTLLEVNTGVQPFESGPFLAGYLSGRPAEDEEVLVHAFTHAYTGNQPAWLDEGLARFMELLWIERNEGRETALSALEDGRGALALLEPDFGQTDAGEGEPLERAHSSQIYRNKAAYVFWMLRGIVGDAALQQALTALRSQPSPDLAAFRRLLESASDKELGWFFEDWVERDRGLPDLSIVSVTPREIERASGYLISVEVANDGSAVAEVPVTVRSGTLTTTERLRIPPHSHRTTRIVFNDKPQQVQVNDGTTPELQQTTHVLNVNLKTMP